MVQYGGCGNLRCDERCLSLDIWSVVLEILKSTLVGLRRAED